MLRKPQLTVFALCLAVGLAFGLTGTARADCSPPGTVNDDTIDCTGHDSDGINAGDGNDLITAQQAAYIYNLSGAFAIMGGAGNDQITLKKDSQTLALKGAGVQGGAGDDTIQIYQAKPGSVDDLTAVDSGVGDDHIFIEDAEFPVYIVVSGPAPGLDFRVP